VPAPKATPRPVAPKQQPKQPQQPAQPVPQMPQEQQQAAADQPPIIYSPWTKFCGKDNNNPQAKEVCLTVKEARLETGQFLAGAALIEQQGEEKKLFRITLPLGMQLPQGTRMVLDKEQPLQGRFRRKFGLRRQAQEGPAAGAAGDQSAGPGRQLHAAAR